MTELDEKLKLNIPVLSGKFLLRLILSPFIFIWGLFLLAAGTFFPVSFLVILSFFGFIIEPFIFLLRLSGADINGIEPLISTKYTMLSHLIGITIYVWGAPAITVNYILTGEIWTGEDNDDC